MRPGIQAPKALPTFRLACKATQAAVRAGYSKKTAHSIGQKLLKNVEIQNAISTIRKILIVDFSSSSPPHHLYGGTDIRATVARYQNTHTKRPCCSDVSNGHDEPRSCLSPPPSVWGMQFCTGPIVGHPTRVQRVWSS
ncbi:terminase small subunit [Acetobacter pasteurianus]|uniref:terminase small subunit n=1 Tax=Acetobacter pasteurianus TaxID=438 RepID=UPI000F5516A0|nr:terminase small subunit [Acetobacter pasteurianus]